MIGGKVVLKLLIVDDEPKVLDALARVLGSDYDVFTADSAAKALLLLENYGPFAVVIADYAMPVMNGIEFLETVKQQFSAVRIMLTGHPDNDVAQAAIRRGDVFLFLAKPFSGASLQEAVAIAAAEYTSRRGYRTNDT